MSIPLKADVYAELSLGQDTKALASARKFVHRTLADLPEMPLSDIVMAVDEAVANVLEHADMPVGTTIDLKLYRDADHVRILLSNDGVVFDGHELAAVDLDRHRQERRTGGLGIFLMQQLMDLVMFRTTREGRQEVVMVKHLRSA